MAKKKAPRKTLAVPRDQWELPVSIGADGQWVSLKEAVESRTGPLSFSQLSLEQQAELVARRIEAQPKFELAMVGAGLVNKEHAIQEVRAQSSLGRALIEIEQRMIARMMKRAQRGDG